MYLKNKKSGSYLLSREERSTIGARGLDFRVRDGNGYGTSAVATDKYSWQTFRLCAKIYMRQDR